MKNKIIRYITIIIPLYLLGSCAPEFKNHYLTSEIEGYLKVDSKPIYNVLLIRVSRSHWYDEKPVIDSVKTDENGYFKFDKRTKFSIITLLHQPVIDQNIKVIVTDTVLKSIHLNKMNYDKNGELNRHVYDEDKGFDLQLHKGKLQLLFNL